MARNKWKLTRAAIGDDDERPEIDEWGDDQGAYRFGYSLLRLLADAPDSGFEEITPGMYWGPKLP